MEKLYSKDKLVSNIEYLLKRNDIKIGDLESECGVSTGYISRLKNNENPDASPSAEVLLRFSKMLKVSLTSLLYCNFNASTETELFVQSSIEEMIKKTESNLLLWEKFSPSQIYYPNDYDGKLFPLIVPCFDEYGNSDIKYSSLFTEEDRYVSDCYYELDRLTQTFYLIPVSNVSMNHQEYELYLQLNDGNIKKICSSNNDSPDIIAKLLKDLYTSVERSCKQIRIDTDVKKGLEDFVLDKDIDPFEK